MSMVKSKWDKVKVRKVFVCRECGRAYLDKNQFLLHKKNHKMSENTNTNTNRNKNKNKRAIELIEISSTTTEEAEDDIEDEDYQIVDESESESEKDDEESESESGRDENGAEEEQEQQGEKDEEEKDDDVMIIENEEESESESGSESEVQEIEEHESSNPVEKNSDKKEEWNCQFCHRQFLTSFHLDRHLSQLQCERQRQPQMPQMLSLSVNVNQEKSHLCPYCDQKFNDSSAFSRHLIVHTGLALQDFPCRTCSARFSNKYTRETHERIHIRDALQPFRCSQCKKGFENEDAWRVHERNHLGLKPYKCRHCGPEERFFTTSGSRLSHERSHIRNQLQPFHCSRCQKGFDNQDDCTAHERRHLGLNPHKCRFCSRFFATTANRDRHEDAHRRNQVKPFQCSRCDKGFDDKDSCLVHERRHFGLNPHPCRFCSRYFGTTVTRDSHEGTHKRNQAKPFHCSRCDKGFANQDDCTIHEKRHLGLNPFPCRFCSRFFGSTATRDSHEATHVRNQVKPFHCDICKQGFDSHDAWKIHERKHFGLNPYPCTFCPRYFSESSNRDRHEKSCSWKEKKGGKEEEISYSCVYCSKSFASQDALNMHVRVHTGN